jgi:menaquinol-cytochrome c reductase iron-sulfur subunit
MDLPTNLPSSTPTEGRRTFMQLLTCGLGAIATAALGIPVVGYLFGARKAPVEWQALGPIVDFPENQTRRVTFDNPIRQPWDGMVAQTGVYVRYLGRDTSESDEGKSHRFLVLAANCAHLGCPVEWFQESGLYLCPCHGGVYYANGERASGPPTRGLYQCVYRVRQTGGVLKLEIQAPHFPTLQDTLNDVA